jgi:RNA-directed DNA polymerase
MTVKAPMPERNLNLVVPLAHKATAMRTTVTPACGQQRTGAVAGLIGASLRSGDVTCTNVALTPGTRTSTTATRTTTTRAMRAEPEPSADSDLFEQLVVAYVDCRRTKRNSTSALQFEQRLEANLLQLHAELAAGTYRPGRSICFVVTRPRPREVWAAEFRDRVVHHLLYNRIAPRFHAAFSAESCACIPGRGTLYAAHRLEHHVRSVTANWARPAHYLKCDMANFFVSIDKHVLWGLLAKRVHEVWWLRLARTVLFHDPRQEVIVQSPPALLRQVPPQKSLFNAPADTGLPIGNLSSQFFGNVLLDSLDQFVKHRLRARHYVRYVDDFLLLHESPAWLNQAREQIESHLQAALPGTRLNPKKTILQPVARGIDFVGHVVKPWHTQARRRLVRHAVQRVRTAPADELLPVMNSYFGLLGQSSHSHADRARLAKAVLGRGHCVDARFTKGFEKARP